MSGMVRPPLPKEPVLLLEDTPARTGTLALAQEPPKSRYTAVGPAKASPPRYRLQVAHHVASCLRMRLILSRSSWRSSSESSSWLKRSTASRRTCRRTRSWSIMDLAIGRTPFGPGLGVFAHRRGFYFFSTLPLNYIII